MASYLFLYRSPNEKNPNMSPEEMQKVMQSWFAWIGEGMAAGWMTNAGDALKPEGFIVHADKSVTDGPFAESKEIIGGYSIIEAESYELAIEHAKGCPVFKAGGHVEIRELAMVEIEQTT